MKARALFTVYQQVFSWGKCGLLALLCSMALSIALPEQLYAQIKQQVRVLYPNGNSAPLTVLRMNSRQYCSVPEIAKVFFPGSKIQFNSGVEIVTKTIRVAFAPSSFFIRVQSTTELRMAQMPFPAVELANELYVPLEPFLRAVELCGVLGVKKTARGIAVVRNKLSPSVRSFQEEQQESLLLTDLPVSAKGEIITDGIITGLEFTPPEAWSVKPLFEESKISTTQSKDTLVAKPTEVPQELQRATILDDSAKIQLRSILSVAAADIASIGSAKRPAPIVPVTVPEVNTPQDIQPLPSTKKTDLPPTPNSYQLPPGLRRRDIGIPSLPMPQQQNVQPKDSIAPEIPLNPEGRKRYILPPGLKRKDETTLLQRMPSELFAELTPNIITPEEKKKIEITEITANEQFSSFIFYSSQPLHSYQKPEIQGNNIILRIPQALHQADGSIQKLAQTQIFKGINVRIVRDVVVYVISFSSSVLSADIKRISPNAISLNVHIADNEKTLPTNENRAGQKWLLDVLVLDAGHGGEDVGAIGVNGTREKDVTLLLVKKIKKHLQKKLPALKVVLTRDDDTFIELFRRGQIANENNGKLFISVHCNSTEKKPSSASGAETYILRPGRNDDALRVAQRENSVVKLEKQPDRYKTLTDEEFIIVAMAQRAFVRLSERFADLLQTQVQAKTSLPNRGVKQAGFFVLVGASMPNVLFEAGYLSNPREEAFLASEKGQNAIAEAVADAITFYAEEYNKNIGE